MRLRNWKSLLPAVALLAGSALSPAQTPQQKAWQILRSGAAEKGSDERAKAIGALGLLLHDPGAATIAEKALGDDRFEVRAAAARALGAIRLGTSVPKLRKALSDKESSVVMAAAHSLILFKDNAGYEVYYAVLKGERKSGEGLISQGMDLLREPKKVAEYCFEEGIGFAPYAGYGLSAFEYLRKEEVSSASLKAAAAKVLADDPDPQTSRALVQAVSDKRWQVRGAALEAIAKRGDPSLLQAIQTAMSDKNDIVRYTAAAAVIRLAAVAKAKKAQK
jgi:HEAT repeat protein